MTKRNLRLMSILVVLLVATFARLWHFGAAPPGLQHDEIFKAQEGQSIVEEGNWRVFYASNQGHEGGYVWLMALSYLLFGANMVMVKLPALWCGLLTLAMLYRFARDFFNYRTALLATGLAAVSFWMVFTNRVGLRANSLPLVTLIVLWGIWRVCFYRPLQSHQRWQTAVFTGIALGFAIYTYTAAFVLYIAFGAFLVGLLVFDRATLKRRLPELLLITVLGTVLTLPMLHYRLSDPIGRNRVSTINYPWTEFKKGNPDPIINNAKLLLQMPFLKGDPEWRYNVAGRPLFLLPIGLLVYAGLLLSVWRSPRQPLNVMLIVLALVGLVPSLLTTSAPSFLRSIITLPTTMIFIGVAIDALGRKTPPVNREGRYRVGEKGSKREVRNQIIWILGILIITITAVVDGRAYFSDWVGHQEVFAIYRDDLQQLAHYLRHSGERVVVVSTSEPAVLDPAVYYFSNAPRQPQVMWFDGRVDIALSQTPRLLFVSPLAPISPAHAEWLSADKGTQRLDPVLRQDGSVAFEVYRLHGEALTQRLEQVGQGQVYLSPDEPYAYPINFGDVLQLVGIEMPNTTIPQQDNGVDNGLVLQLYLQPLTNDFGQPLSIFVHFMAEDGTVVFGRDFLGSPANSWHTGITFIQDNYVGSYSIPAGHYFVAMGLYNTITGERFPVLDKTGKPLGDQVILGQIEAVSP